MFITEKKNLKTRRVSQINAISQLERGIEKAYKYKEEHGEWPWNIETFLVLKSKHLIQNMKTRLTLFLVRLYEITQN